MEQNESAPAAAATAYSLAKTFERPLLVLHVRTAAEIRAGKDPCLEADFGVKLPPRSHHALSGGSGWLLNEAPVHCLVKDGDPADAVAEAIAENHPCILVAGVKRSSATPGPHGTAFALLSASRVPVLCVPPERSRIQSKWEIALPVGAL
jgi:nucleotide-binding universal stress UspA family protein